MAGAPHIIRLRGPWQYRALARFVLQPDDSVIEEATADLPPPGRINMPATWNETLSDDFQGRVLFSRRFNCPTGLSAQHRVDLVVENIPALGRAALNDLQLGELAPDDSEVRFDITSMLRPHNELMIEIAPPRQSDQNQLPRCVVGEVRLEIRADHATFE